MSYPYFTNPKEEYTLDSITRLCDIYINQYTKAKALPHTSQVNADRILHNNIQLLREHISKYEQENGIQLPELYALIELRLNSSNYNYIKP